MDGEARAVHVELSAEIKLIQTDIKYIREAISDIKDVIQSNDAKYASAKDLARLENAVYGLGAFIVISIIGAVIANILK